MGYILGQCPQCNNVMSMPDDSAQVQCPTCRSIVMAAEAAALAGTADQLQQGAPVPPAPSPAGEPVGSPYRSAVDAAQQTPGQTGQGPYGNAASSRGIPPAPPTPDQFYAGTGAPAPTGTAFGGAWKTNALFTVIGILLAAALNGLIELIDADTPATIISLAYVIFGIFYAARIYPSYFTDKPVVQGNELISCLNGFVGGIIFGLLWNHNLTLNSKGVSHIVFIVLVALTFVLAFALVGIIGAAVLLEAI